MGVFTPVAAPPRRIRASLGPARFTRVATQRQVPPAPKVPRSLLSQTATRCNNRPRRPASCCRPWSCPASVPIAGNDSRRQARIAEAVGVGRARRRPRRFRGWLCAELSKHQRRGATPAKGGKPSAAVFSANIVGQEKRRARFWAASPPASPRPLAGNPWKARSTHLRQDERTTNRDPRPMGQSGSNFWDEQGTNQSGAGVGSPRSRRLDEQGTTPTPPKGTRQSHRWEDAPRTSTPTPPRRAQEQRQLSHQVGTSIALALGRGCGGCRGVGKRESKPKRRARWGNDQVGTNTGMILARVSTDL